MDWKTVKVLIHLSLCFSLVNSQGNPSTSTSTTTQRSPSSSSSPSRSTTTSSTTARPQSTTPSPSRNTTSSPSRSTSSTPSTPPNQPDQATIDRYRLNVGAANVDYGPYAYHGKYIPSSTDRHFSYDENHPRGPSRWAQQWPMCGGPLQSPIDVPLSQCVSADPIDVPLQYYNSGNPPSNVTIENNGYSIELLFHFEDTPVLYGGPLEDGYIFEFIHFHWGLQNGGGSEHALDGTPYDLEMHIGHRNNKYADMAEAGMNPDGILVLAFVFQVSDQAGEWPQMAELDAVQSVNSSVLPQDPQNYMLTSFVGDLQEQVLNVRGSLTTPPCSPANWLLVPQPREISQSDMEKFRRARRNGQTIAPNNRPLQNTENRECTSYGETF